MLNFLPMPNYVDPTNVNNLELQEHVHRRLSQARRHGPHRLQHYAHACRFTGATCRTRTSSRSPYGLWVNGGINYLLAPITFGQPGKGHVAHITKSITPTLVNEFIFGNSQNKLYFYPTDASLIDRAKVGNPGQWYSDSTTGVSYVDKTNYMPNITFGGNHANPAVVTFGNIPYENYNTVMSFVDNVSKVMGSAQHQSGRLFEHTEKFQVGGTNPRGAFDFSTTTTNPFDSGDGFSNALLGVINTYSEGNRARQRRLDLQQPGVLRSGQLARQQAVDPRHRHAVLSPAAADRHQPDHRRLQPLPVQPGRMRPCCTCRSSTRTASEWRVDPRTGAIVCQSADRHLTFRAPAPTSTAPRSAD